MAPHDARCFDVESSLPVDKTLSARRRERHEEQRAGRARAEYPALPIVRAIIALATRKP